MITQRRLFLRPVNAQLLEGVDLELLETVDVQDADFPQLRIPLDQKLEEIGIGGCVWKWSWMIMILISAHSSRPNLRRDFFIGFLLLLLQWSRHGG